LALREATYLEDATYTHLLASFYQPYGHDYEWLEVKGFEIDHKKNSKSKIVTTFDMVLAAILVIVLTKYLYNSLH